MGACDGMVAVVRLYPQKLETTSPKYLADFNLAEMIFG
jgi:hypothetical protein